LLTLDRIDNGKAFDWGNTSEDYGKYRDIYPHSYYSALEKIGFPRNGQSILDIGTGTGVISRTIYNPTLSIIGIDISDNQIKKAKELSSIENKKIDYYTKPAEDTSLKSKSFDSIIAAQCYIYFDISRLMNEIDRLLRPGGKFYITWFCWLPLESKVAESSEELILKYNPDWKGAGLTRDFEINFDTEPYNFTLQDQIRYDERIPFTKESWAGRIRATRGIGAVLNDKDLTNFNKEHLEQLDAVNKEELQIPHLILINSYKRKNE